LQERKVAAVVTLQERKHQYPVSELYLEADYMEVVVVVGIQEPMHRYPAFERHSEADYKVAAAVAGDNPEHAVGRRRMVEAGSSMSDKEQVAGELEPLMRAFRKMPLDRSHQEH
jgi:hypothetical protein